MMMRTFAALTLALAALAPLGAVAQQPPPKAPVGEILLLNPPAGWVPQQVQKTDKAEVTRLLPPGQTEKDWTEMMLVQIFPGPDGQPIGYVENAVNVSRKNCDAAGASPTNRAQVNNYPFASVTITCTKGKASGKGSVMMIHGIRGKEALYVVQRQWRGQPFDKDTAPPIPADIAQQWTTFRVGLCDTRAPKHPCPN
jgi:hypothetical protein